MSSEWGCTAVETQGLRLGDWGTKARQHEGTKERENDSAIERGHDGTKERRCDSTLVGWCDGKKNDGMGKGNEQFESLRFDRSLMLREICVETCRSMSPCLI